jgi:hypothetical protein
MGDEPFYKPGRTPDPPRQPQPGERLFEFYRERDHTRWLRELRDHGEPYGVEAQFFQKRGIAVQSALRRADGPAAHTAGTGDRVGRGREESVTGCRSMIARPTVLILGAGASKPYGFPLGVELADLIVAGLRSRFKNSVRHVLRECGFDSAAIQSFQKQLLWLGAETVDRFLQHQPQLMTIGRVAIAAVLVPREDVDHLRPAHDDWYRYLFNQILADGAVRGSRLNVLTFNYDRSFEEGIYRRIHQGLNRSEAEAAEDFLKTYVLHLHGQLGALPWWSTACDGPPRPYQRECAPKVVAKYAEQILVVGEPVLETEGAFEDARAVLEKAEVICFIGFGYHRDSLRRLRMSEFTKGRELFGTAHGLTDERRQQVLQEIPGIQLGAPAEETVAFLERTGVLELPAKTKKQSPPTGSGGASSPQSWMGH